MHAALLVSLIFAIAPGTLLFVLLQVFVACAKVDKRPARQSHHSSHHSTPSRTVGPLSSQNVSSPALPKESPQSVTANSASFEEAKQGSSQQNREPTTNDSSYVPEPGKRRNLEEDKKKARFAFLHHLLKKTSDKQRKRTRLRGQIKKPKPVRKSDKEMEPTQTTGLDTTQIPTDQKAQAAKTDATLVSAWSQNTTTCTARDVNSKVNTALFINELK